MSERRKVERRKYGRKVTYPFIDSDGVLVTKNRRRLVDRRLENTDITTTEDNALDESKVSGMHGLDLSDSKVMELEDALSEDDGPASKIEETIKEIESQILEQTSIDSKAVSSVSSQLATAAKTKNNISKSIANKKAKPEPTVDKLPEIKEEKESKPISIELRVGENKHIFTQDDDDCLIGRDPACDVIVQGKFVSRAHAKISFKDGKFLLEDNSFNGTYVKFTNGQKIHVAKDEQTLIADGVLCMGEPVKEDNKYAIKFKLL